MGWSRGNEGKRPVLTIPVFRDLVFRMIPGDTFGVGLNLPNSGVFSQKKPVPI
jgi:hypothetical protein